jgi:glycosyltransferase involved in cell wall biosynthesis
VLKFSLGVPDVHWISLKPEVEGLIVPSKVYGIAAAGRPIIAICAKDGEISEMVEQYQCGVIVEPGNADALVNSILQLSKDTALRTNIRWGDKLGRCSKPISPVGRHWSFGGLYSKMSGDRTDLS